jgi:hypothetical protein
MNPTTEKLRTAYAIRFLVSASCIAAASMAARLLTLGRTGDHVLEAVIVVGVCGVAGVWIGITLFALWRDLKQIEYLRRHGPYGQREFVPPHEATRTIGDSDGRNMWA